MFLSAAFSGFSSVWFEKRKMKSEIAILLWIFTQTILYGFQLFSARDMAQKTVIGQDQIVYSTDRDLLDQDYEANEWDKKFRELERSD